MAALNAAGVGANRMGHMPLRSVLQAEHDDEPQRRLDAAIRAKSPQQRLAILDAMWRSAQQMISHRLRTMHPDWDDARIARETARRLSHGAF